jgi:ubiquinone/menaquinone biosynthesis C-methylase UbiE
MPARTLTHDEARAFYDRFGSKQDLQRFYEDPAVDVLLRHAAFEDATAVVELGCGTGRLAERLLRERLPSAATYLGVDSSSTMVALARSRLAPWGDRARVERSDGSPRIPAGDAACDRFLSTYVLDLLSEDDIDAALREAQRVLAPGGLLCLASLTFGETVASRLVCRLWSAVHSLRPALVGGCRPLRLAGRLGAGWTVSHHQVVCTLGLCTEVLVAVRRAAGG